MIITIDGKMIQSCSSHHQPVKYLSSPMAHQASIIRLLQPLGTLEVLSEARAQHLQRRLQQGGLRDQRGWLRIPAIE